MSTGGPPLDVWQEFRAIPRHQCFRSTIAWGLGLGVLFGAHRYKQGGP